MAVSRATKRTVAVAGNFEQLLLFRFIAGVGSTAVITGTQIVVADIPTAAMPVASTKVMINLGYAIKATRLLELDALIAARRTR